MNQKTSFPTFAFSLDHLFRTHGRLHSYLPKFEIIVMFGAMNAAFSDSEITQDLRLVCEPFSRRGLLKSSPWRAATGE